MQVEPQIRKDPSRVYSDFVYSVALAAINLPTTLTGPAGSLSTQVDPHNSLILELQRLIETPEWSLYLPLCLPSHHHLPFAHHFNRYNVRSAPHQRRYARVADSSKSLRFQCNRYTLHRLHLPLVQIFSIHDWIPLDTLQDKQIAVNSAACVTCVPKSGIAYIAFSSTNQHGPYVPTHPSQHVACCKNLNTAVSVKNLIWI